MQTSQATKNKSMQSVTSKSYKGEMLTKNMWNEFGGRGEITRKKCKRHEWHPKMNSRIHPNRTMGKCSKSGEKVWGKGREGAGRNSRKGGVF